MDITNLNAHCDDRTKKAYQLINELDKYKKELELMQRLKFDKIKN
jgi:hypothetical protein